MNLIEFINKIKKLTVEDKVRLVKKFVIGCTAITILIFVIGTANNFIKDYQEKRYVYEDAPEDYAKQVENHTYKLQTSDEDYEPTENQKSDFSKYNCLEFSNITIKDNQFSVEVTNTSNNKVKDVSIKLYNKKKSPVATLSMNTGDSIKPGEKYLLEGYVFEDDVYIDNYTFKINNTFTEVNLTHKSAITTENSEDEHLD